MSMATMALPLTTAWHAQCHGLAMGFQDLSMPVMGFHSAGMTMPWALMDRHDTTSFHGLQIITLPLP